MQICLSELYFEIPMSCRIHCSNDHLMIQPKRSDLYGKKKAGFSLRTNK
jgi:hypothetical protein